MAANEVPRIQIATAVLVRDGLILLAHRHPQRHAYADRWSFVGGHVDPGESPGEAVARECLEEIGVQIHHPVPFPMTVDNPDLEMHAFLVTQWTGDPSNAAPEEHDELGWFHPSALATLRMAHPESVPGILTAVRRATGTTGPVSAADGVPRTDR
ncbi:NUDIX domain-containing protein [Kribbella sp. NPDC051770]|uniref:NUDIX domain-containing protein n=1 Tax=Kribbella sp. NPDC051770 TaxID=3155413 RepID=UPI00343EA1DA